MSDMIQHHYQFCHWKWLSILITASILVGCKSSPDSLKSFYFPLNTSDGLVYQYQRTTNGNASDTYYCFYKSHLLDGQKHFTGQYYEADGRVSQFYRQMVDDGGIEMESYLLYEADTLDPTTVKVVHDDIFPFYPSDTMSVYLYRVSYESKLDSSVTTITRNRRYIGKESWTHNQKTYEAIRFGLLERIENDKNGVVTIDLKGHEIYAKDVGLVYLERKSDEGALTLIDQLVDRIEMTEFENRFQK